MDLPGTAAFTTAAATVTYALIRVGENGWSSATTLGLFGLGAAAFAAFVLVELRSSRPMLDLSLFRSPSFVAVMAASLLMSGAAFAYLMYVSLWLQTAEGMGPVGAGLALVPLSLAGFFVAAATGKLMHAVSYRITIGGGLFLIGAGALLQGWMLDAGDGWTALVPGLLVTGVGVGMISPAVAAAAMGSVPPARVGMAGGALNTARQLGTALGIAVLGAVFQAGLADGLEGSGRPHGTAEALAADGAGKVLAAAPEAAGWVEAAFASGLRETFWVSGAMGLAGALIFLVLFRTTAAQPPADRRGPAGAGAAAGVGEPAAGAAERAAV
ncbi:MULTISPECIES: MFS transporter [unclassified Streptomyces]|uniref:MFS transporter n=1 Tax=unclassified Streptomyces TaxID=2593676 RepID=UPI000DC76FD9|nr:hypothetical protein DRB89_17975 [Streptomyces sp. ICC4]AWZ13820.1 hypothetical protein DRB96_17670 [Streptomyces sp. ICC1]